MISLVICTYNRDKYIYQTLKKISANKFPTDKYEIILVDNNSTDDTSNLCKQFETENPNINYKYFLELNQGLSYARNRGIKESSGSLIVFLDDDSFVDNDYLQNLSSYIESYSDMAAFGGRISPLYESGSEPFWMNPWLYSLVSAIDKGSEVLEFNGKSYPIGANMGFTRECIEKCGDFNVKLGRSGKNFIGGEEKDIFERIKSQGFKIYYFPKTHVHHVIPESRTTLEYIRKAAVGIGKSERYRTKPNSNLQFLCSLAKEICIKWPATLLLWLIYSLSGHLSKANVLVMFRKYVTLGLLDK